ncbi:tail fiber assembly protein [Citrobacter freundii complex sp. 2024EL-00228]|nr:tail fiber assembly protein [Citrobacter freundii]QLY63201.1 tail fiber assembly protein [Citrobacter freundii]QMF24407.1 tail fiber assembly protein [Citrobacter freundii]
MSAKKFTELTALCAYHTALRRIGLTIVSDINWPEYPGAWAIQALRCLLD